MADTKITALAAITTVDPAADVLPIVDISDTSMAASGTTKKITSNQILGAGGTATLASATITGDLTVRTTGLTVNANGVGVGVVGTLGAGNIQIGAGKYLGYSATAYITPEDNVQGARIKANQVLLDATDCKFNINNSEAMRLNSTGLGVGDSPSYKLHVARNADGTVGYFRRIGATINPALTVYCNETGNTVGFGTDYAGATSPAITFTTAGTERLRIDSSGRLLVGSTTAFTDLTGSKEVKIGDGGIQTFTSAIAAATPTNIARGGVGGLVYVGGFNGTGQYGAVVLWTSASATVVSVINNTGSTITFGVSAGFLQITSSLALTTVGANCIRL